MGELDTEGTLPEIRLTLAAAPVALVQGRPLMDLPRDLYIPPEALRVFLETFEGPWICFYTSSSDKTWISCISRSPRSPVSTCAISS